MGRNGIDRGIDSLVNRSEPSEISFDLIEVAPAPTPMDQDGLWTWLEQLNLLKIADSVDTSGRYDKALQWCDEMGAVFMQEVEEHWEELADVLELKRIERTRVAKRVGAAPTC